MNAKEFLSQAYKLDAQIVSKTEMIASLNEEAQRCTSALDGMPHSPDIRKSPMEEAVGKILDLQIQVGKDLDRLLTVRSQIINVIDSIENPDYRLLLEKRYICGNTWREVAIKMNYDKRWIQRMHEKAIAVVQERLTFRFPEYAQKN